MMAPQNNFTSSFCCQFRAERLWTYYVSGTELSTGENDNLVSDAASEKNEMVK